LAPACAEIKILRGGPTALGFSTFDFFSRFLFTLGFFFAAVIGLLPGLLGVKKGFRKSHQGGQFLTREQLGVVAGNLAPSFSLNFLSIFGHI